VINLILSGLLFFIGVQLVTVENEEEEQAKALKCGTAELKEEINNRADEQTQQWDHHKSDLLSDLSPHQQQIITTFVESYLSQQKIDIRDNKDLPLTPPANSPFIV